jgi:hypothetical protein
MGLNWANYFTDSFFIPLIQHHQNLPNLSPIITKHVTTHDTHNFSKLHSTDLTTNPQ